MRNIMLIVLIISSLVVLVLYLTRINTVPAPVRDALHSEQGLEINRMTQTPEAARKKIKGANDTAEQRLEDALKDIEK
jgi:hypothetical protein